VPREVLDEYVQNRDPVKRFEHLLLSHAVVDAEAAKGIQERIEGEFDEGYEFAQASPFPVPRT